MRFLFHFQDYFDDYASIWFIVLLVHLLLILIVIVHFSIMLDCSLMFYQGNCTRIKHNCVNFNGWRWVSQPKDCFLESGALKSFPMNLTLLNFKRSVPDLQSMDSSPDLDTCALTRQPWLLVQWVGRSSGWTIRLYRPLRCEFQKNGFPSVFYCMVGCRVRHFWCYVYKYMMALQAEAIQN